MVKDSVCIFCLIPCSSECNQIICKSFIRTVNLFSVQLRPFTFHSGIHFSCVRVVNTAKQHSSKLCQSDWNATMLVIKNKVRRSVNRIYNEAISISKFLLHPVFLCKECRFRYKLTQILDQIKLNLLVMLCHKVCSSFFIKNCQFLVLCLKHQFPCQCYYLHDFIV